MRLATERDREAILAYLRPNVQDCLYLYIDILCYGVASDHMRVWFDTGGDGISLVVMQYYDSMQLYCREPLGNAGQAADLLAEYPVSMVSGRRDIIARLEPLCPAYRASYGAVFLMDRYRRMRTPVVIHRAPPEWAGDIAALICSDEEIGGHYTPESLTAQLAERIATKTGRSYVVRENGVILAHTATYAEAEGVAVVGGTIIRPECRDRNYYMLLSNYMLEQLAREGKTAYTFSISEKMVRYHGTLHTKCGEYGKLVRKTI